MKTRTWQITLRKWFSPEDPLSTVVATLCILREDYFIDLIGLNKGGINVWAESQNDTGFPDLDENSSGWRRLYFFRNSLRTLTKMTQLKIELEQEEDGRWIGEVPTLPGVMAYGQTRAAALAAVQALALRAMADRLNSMRPCLRIC